MAETDEVIKPTDIPRPVPLPTFIALQRVPTNEVGDIVSLQIFNGHGNFVFFLEPKYARQHAESILALCEEIETGLTVISGHSQTDLRAALARAERLRG